MSRFGTGLGFNIQDIALISGIATEIFNANVANLTGVGSGFAIGQVPVNYSSIAGFTWGAWISSSTLDTTRVIISSSTSGGLMHLDFSIDAVTNGLSVAVNVVSPAGFQYVTSSTNITDGDWHCVAFTYVKATRTVKLYVDGILDTTGVLTGDPHFLDNPETALGKFAYQDVSNFSGSMFKNYIYRRVLTDAELLVKANGGTPLCWDEEVLSQPSLSDAVFDARLYNGAGVAVGQELVDNSVNAYPISNTLGTPFTGSAQIECEA